MTYWCCLLYMNFKSVTETLIVSFFQFRLRLSRSIWLLYLLGYNLSVAVWVGMIALAGLAAQTGVVMIIYLDEPYMRWKAEGKMKNKWRIFMAQCTRGGRARVRPKMMTVMSTTLGTSTLNVESRYRSACNEEDSRAYGWRTNNFDSINSCDYSSCLLIMER